MNKSVLYLVLCFAVISCSKKEKQTKPVVDQKPRPAVKNTETEKTANDDNKAEKLTVAFFSSEMKIDPHVVHNPQVSEALGLSFEALFEFDQDTRPYSVKPLLLAKMPVFSEGNKTVTFELKKGIHFADHEIFNGEKRELKAKDVVHNILRMCDPKIPSAIFWAFDNMIVGLNDWRTKNYQAEITDYSVLPLGLEVLDDYHFQIHLTQPYPQLFKVLSLPASAIVAPETVGLSNLQIGGTGPYQISISKDAEESNPHSKKNWVFHRNENYHAELPHVATVEYVAFSDADKAKEAYIFGNIDILPLTREIKSFFTGVKKGDEAQSQTPTLLEQFQKEHSIIQRDKLDVVYLSFNHKNPVIKNAGVEFRKAISMAIDRKAIVDKVYLSLAEEAHSLVPPNLLPREAQNDDKSLKYDFEQAKETIEKLVKEGKYKNEMIFLDTVAGDIFERQASLVAQNLAKIGVKIEVTVNSFPELLQKIARGESQLWFLSWAADLPDPGNFYQLLHSSNSPNERNASGINGAQFELAIFDFLYDKFSVLIDETKKTIYLKKMGNVFLDHLPLVPLVHTHGLSIHKNRLSNLKPSFPGLSTLKWIEVPKADTKKDI